MVAFVLLLAVVLTACSNTPPPPVVSSPVAQMSTPPAETPSQIVAIVDDIAGGYNPHTLADASTITTALSQLLLPSVFRPDEDGTLQLDDSLMTSAEVTSEEPFTVTYRIRPEASWSDGAPIAVEDFVYLAEAMKSQPGVINPAGYELIERIEPGEGGKLVRVTFAEPYPGWKTLFDNLLPAHLLKDAPGGWAGALADGFPTYGGPFSIKTIDIARGEIIIERNERYWDKPAAVDRVVLQRSDSQGTVSALRNRTAQFTLGSVTGDTRNLLENLGEDVALHTIARPFVAEVVLRPVGPALADDKVREAVAALIDRDALIAEGTQGGDAAKLRASAQVRSPSSEDYQHTIPAAGSPRERDSEKAYALLAEAGFEREAGSWVRDGETLSLVLASPREKQPYARITDELSRQLIAEGIEVTTVEPPSRELFTSALAAPVDLDGGGLGQPMPTNGQVGIDIAVIPRAVSADPATTLASWFGCAPNGPGEAADDANGSAAEREAEAGDDGGSTSTEPDADQPQTESTEPSESTDPAGDSATGESGESDGSGWSGADPATADAEDAVVVPANPAGFCDPSLEPAIEAALTGEQPLRQVLSEVEPALWDHWVSIPLFQLADTLAVGGGVSGLSVAPPLVGPFSSAVDWTRAPR